MEKNEVVSKLQKMNCEIAEVKCNISRCGKVTQEGESILVRLVDNPSNEDKISNGEHWDLFDNIKDFENNTYYRASADTTYDINYISDFTSVEPFVAD